MNASLFLQAMNDVDDAFIWQSEHSEPGKKDVPVKYPSRFLFRAIMAAAIIIAFAATVYGAGALLDIWNDRWLQTPSVDPIQLVQEAIDRQMEKDYTVSVQVEEILEDEAETQRVYDWAPDSMLAMLNGYGARPEALEGKTPEEVKAVYARYTVVYDHTKTFYRDGTLYQYFYLVQNTEGTWEIFESTDALELQTFPSEPGDASLPADTEASAAETDYSEAIAVVLEMIERWEAFEDVSKVTIQAAAFDQEQTEAALQRLVGTAFAQGNGWTEDFLTHHMAAITVTYTIWQDGNPQTETACYWLLQDPASGAWYPSEITGFMDAPEQ